MTDDRMTFATEQIHQYYDELAKNTPPFMGQLLINELNPHHKEEYDNSIALCEQHVKNNRKIEDFPLLTLMIPKINDWELWFKINSYKEVEFLVHNGQAEKAARMFSLILSVWQESEKEAKVEAKRAWPMFTHEFERNKHQIFFHNIYMVRNILKSVQSTEDQLLAAELICWINKSYPYKPSAYKENNSYKFSAFLDQVKSMVTAKQSDHMLLSCLNNFVNNLSF